MISSRQLLVAAALIIVSVFLIWGSILGHGFADSDFYPVLLTSQIHSFGDLISVFSDPLMEDRMVNGTFYRPLYSLSVGINEWFSGLSPRGYHLVNLLILAASGITLYSLVRTLMEFFAPGRSRSRLAHPAAIATAVLFCIHPIHEQIIAVSSRRADALHGLFALATVLFFCRFLMSRARAALIATLACTFFAAGAKEIGVLVPGYLGLICVFAPADRIWGNRFRWMLRVLWPPLAVIVGFVLLRCALFGGFGGYQNDDESLFALMSPDSIASRTRVILTVVAGLQDTIVHWLRQAASWGTAAWLAVLFAIACLFLAGFAFNRRDSHYRFVAFAGLSVLFAAQPLDNPRYYFVVVAWTCVLVCLLVMAVVERRSIRPGGRFIAGLVASALIGLTILQSPLIDRSGLDEWKKAADLNGAYLEDVVRTIDAHGDERIFLVTIPLAIMPPFRGKLLLLDHSVEAWLELVGKTTEVVGVNYMTIASARLGKDVPVSITARRIADAPGVQLIRTIADGHGRIGHFPFGIPSNERRRRDFEFYTAPHVARFLFPLSWVAIHEGGESPPVTYSFQGTRITRHDTWEWSTGVQDAFVPTAGMPIHETILADYQQQRMKIKPEKLEKIREFIKSLPLGQPAPN